MYNCKTTEKFSGLALLFYIHTEMFKSFMYFSSLPNFGVISISVSVIMVKIQRCVSGH